MNSSANSPDGLAFVCNRLLDDGDLNDHDRDFCTFALKDSSSAQSAYVDWIVLDELLKNEFFGLGQIDPKAVFGLINISTADTTTRESLVAEGQRGISSFSELSTDYLSSRRKSYSSLTFHSLLRSSTATTCAIGLCFYGIFVLMVWQLGNERVTNRLPHDGHDLVTADFTHSIVGTLQDQIDCKWGHETILPTEGETLVAGQPFQLTSGLARVQLHSGASILVEGPAEFVVKSANDIQLAQGKLVAQVPQQAKGFSVYTPKAKFIDLGTEFGIQVSSNGNAEVQVFEGRISIQPVARNGVVPDALVLSAGESRLIKAAATTGDVLVVDVPGKRQQFVRRLPRSSSAKTAYPKSLVSYWRFDEDHGPAWDEAGTSHGDVKSSNRIAGLIGRGAVQHQGNAGQLARIVSREADQTFTHAISVEALFLSSWSGRPHDNDYLCRRQEGAAVTLAFVLKNDEEDDVDGPVLALEISTNRGYRSLDMPLDGRHGRPSLAMLTDGNLHHAAATFDGLTGRMAIYMDGQQCMKRSIEAKTTLATGQGVASVHRSDRNFNDPFSGVLDEIAIYRDVLSHEEIIRHWNNVIRDRNYFTQP